MLDGGGVVAETFPGSSVLLASARRDVPRPAPVLPPLAETQRLRLCTQSSSPDTVRGTSDRARTPRRQGEDPVRTPTTVEEMGAC